MNIFFLPPDALGASGEVATSIPESTRPPIRREAPAANADRLSDADREADRNRTQRAPLAPPPGIDVTGGWDAYEVWRRLIKDARDRRRKPDSH